MKKLVQINVVCGGSTGKIMCDIAKKANEYNYEAYCFYGRGESNKNINSIKIANKLSVYFHVLLARLGFNGYGSYFSTKKMIKKIKKINPDVIHMHNIHGYYLNLKVLFKYLKKEYKGKIIWTLHDCWAFTGHCAHFTNVKCNKWKKKCFNCPQLNSYPKELFDTTKREYKLKKKLFTGINNLTVVTPSIWLKELVSISFLREYKILVINNGINLNIFKPIYDDDIYRKYNISNDKKIILGVASVWTKEKGLYDFIKLSHILPNDYTIVLVGITNNLLKILPSNIVPIKRTDNQYDLAKLYTLATVFFNPTYEDNYPTTNLESIACNTPVVSYDTGGCKEQISNSTGIIIKKGDYKKIIPYIKKHSKKIKYGNFQSINGMIDQYSAIYEE